MVSNPTQMASPWRFDVVTFGEMLQLFVAEKFQRVGGVEVDVASSHGFKEAHTCSFCLSGHHRAPLPNSHRQTPCLACTKSWVNSAIRSSFS